MRRYFFLVMALGITSGCKDGDVQTYRLAKGSSETAAAPAAVPEMPHDHPPVDGNASGSPAMTVMPGMAVPDEATRKNVTWKTPSGWKEQPASQMRVGSFLVRGKNGQDSDVSIVPLGGMAGTDIDNINRWRGQINLDPISPSELPNVLQKIKAGSRTVSFVSMVSRDALIEQKYKRRLMSAWFEEGGQIWFVKMLGEDSNVEAAKPALLELVGSMKIRT